MEEQANVDATVESQDAGSGQGSGPSVSLTANAAKRVAQLIEQEGGEGLMLRVSVSGGGCSGFQYGFSFDDMVNADDRTFVRDGVTLVVDEVSPRPALRVRDRLRGRADRRLLPDQEPPGFLLLRLRLVIRHLAGPASPRAFVCPQSWLIPKNVDIDPFHRWDLFRSQGAVRAMVWGHHKRAATQ